MCTHHLWAGTRMNKHFLEEGSAPLPYQLPAQRRGWHCRCVHVVIYICTGKGSGRSPSCNMHSANIQPSTFLLISTLNQLRTQEKDKKACLFLASVIREWQKPYETFCLIYSLPWLLSLLSLIETCPGWSVLCYSSNFLVFYLFPLPLKSCSEVPLLPAGQERLWEQIVILD